MAKLQANLVKVLRRHRKLVWLFLFVTLVSTGLTIWSYDRKPRAPRVPAPIAAAISFQSYSNSPSGQRWAIMTVTNNDFGTLFILSGSCLVEVSNQPAFSIDDDWQCPRPLPPHSSTSVVIEVPASLGTWRARCGLMRFTWRDKIPNIFPRWWPDFLDPRTGTHAQGGLISDWVSSEDAQHDKQPN